MKTTTALGWVNGLNGSFLLAYSNLLIFCITVIKVTFDSLYSDIAKQNFQSNAVDLYGKIWFCVISVMCTTVRISGHVTVVVRAVFGVTGAWAKWANAFDSQCSNKCRRDYSYSPQVRLSFVFNMQFWFMSDALFLTFVLIDS